MRSTMLVVPPEMPTHYDILGVHPNAPVEDIRRSYLLLARRYHPDYHSDDSPLVRERSEEAMRLLNEAWRVLSDPPERASYDRTLRARAAKRASGDPLIGSQARVAGPHEAADVDDDDTPIGDGGGPPGWMKMAPVVLFALALATLGAGLLLDQSAFLGAAVFLVALAGLALLASALVAMSSSARNDRAAARTR